MIKWTVDKCYYFAIVAISLFWFSCNDQEHRHMPRTDINSVKEAHTSELMAIRGVVGVYVGETKEGNACIYIMVRELTPELRRRIPTLLDGHLVVIEETGEMRPMK